MKTIFITSAALAFAASSGACGTTAGNDPPDAGCFVAYDPVFATFRGWTSFTFNASNDVAGDTHFEGPRTEYVNRLPPHGSSAFPTGTNIVKDIAGITPDTHHIYAMVKRGCGFNASGARDWEWFELSEASGSPSILWRGASPPPGENYAGVPAGDCNTCHAACANNDHVCDLTYLSLRSF